jgi:hypothetical protein
MCNYWCNSRNICILDEEITKLNEPIRYSSTRLKYFYTEQDIKGIFDKAESHYKAIIEEKDELINHQSKSIYNLGEELCTAKELLQGLAALPGSKVYEFLNK